MTQASVFLKFTLCFECAAKFEKQWFHRVHQQPTQMVILQGGDVREHQLGPK